MPIFEYECTTCGHRFELVLGFADHEKFHDQPPPCPECASRETRQLVSSFHCKVASGDAADY
jgi:putative FmdB family regulatory protein